MRKGNYRSGTLAVLLLVVLAACQAPVTREIKVDSVAAEIEARKQKDMAIRERVYQFLRLQRIGQYILRESVRFCEKQEYSYGFVVWNNTFFGKKWEKSFGRVKGVTDLLSVAIVDSQSVAEKAGIQVGDILVAVADIPLPVGKKASEKLGEIILKDGKDGRPVAFRFRRNGQELTFEITPAAACDYPVFLENDDVVNAYATGESIHLDRRMMEFIRSDEELALVFSHELAHNTMKHIDAKITNSVIGGAGGFVLDLLAAFAGVNTNGQFTRIGSDAGGAAYSPAYEQEADYVGLYIMTEAGYDISLAADFWRRMAARRGIGIDFTSTHPSKSDRFLGIEEMIKEIKDKQARGLPLEPDMKKRVETAPPQAPER